MRILSRIIGGFTTVGVVGAIIVGTVFLLTAVFGDDQSLVSRIVWGAITATAFGIGYFNEEEADNSGEDNAH